MRIQGILLLCLTLTASVFAQDKRLPPVAERLAAQNALFDERYESDLREFPERATDLGDYRYNDKLADHSLAAIRRRDEANERFLARLQSISTAGFPDQDQLSHELLVRGLEQRIADFELKEYEMPINQFIGIHTELADLPNSVPLDSIKHYQDYVARLHQIPRVLGQTTEVLRQGMKDKLMPPRFLLEKVPVQCEGIINANPYLEPTKKYPGIISTDDQNGLTKQITEAINDEVIPAYRAFAAFVRTEYAPQGRMTLSVMSLPDGEKRYQNDIYEQITTHMAADEIHELGLREMNRIEAEMLTIAKIPPEHSTGPMSTKFVETVRKPRRSATAQSFPKEQQLEHLPLPADIAHHHCAYVFLPPPPLTREFARQMAQPVTKILTRRS